LINQEKPCGGVDFFFFEENAKSFSYTLTDYLIKIIKEKYLTIFWILVRYIFFNEFCEIIGYRKFLGYINKNE